MRALMLEFAKLRRKKVWLICFATAALCLIWMAPSAARTIQGSSDGTTSLLYMAPIVNSIVLTLFAAIISSQACETDHEARALKETSYMKSRPES
ncbi:ABC transporter permease [uncultured Olegusella sp.]|uniref:ABC transporter permease n=1 Tax=uncultured Olegusella sp. TaxID=1979846 RepID=UPI002617D5A0|nr:ABC transporter permease [uncultured Olegusella sp.]